MGLRRRVALETIIAEWPHMSEIEKDLWTLWIFLMLDKRAKILIAALTFAVLAFITAAVLLNMPAEVFLSLGFALGILTTILLAWLILKAISRR